MQPFCYLWGCIFYFPQMDFSSFFDLLLQNIAAASIWELIAVTFGIISVWFARKANILVFPAGILSTSLYIFIFFAAGLYANMGINLYYTIVSIYGWYNWTRKTDNRQELPISWNTKKEQITGIVLLPIIFCLILGLLWLFGNTGKETILSYVQVIDALTTAIFVLGMWYLARKKIENWIFWIVGNLISIPFFFGQGLVFTSFQFVVFLVLAVMGFFEWKRMYRIASGSNNSK